MGDLENYVAAYEAAWPVDLEKILPHPSHPLYPDVLRELIRAELKLSWGKGDPKPLEHYFSTFPGLVDDEGAVRDLTFEEYRQRCLAGESPSPAEYQRRFRVNPEDWPAMEQASTAVPKQPAAPPAPLPTRFTEVRLDLPQPASDSPVENLPHVPGHELLGVLGRGGMGIVYMARHLELNRIVALKMVLAGGHAGPEELTRFRSEAVAVAQLHHPNIVQIFEVGQQDDHPFFSLEFVVGGSLADKLKGTPMAARPAATLMATLARAIDFAHQRGIIHRDLKPANVLLTVNGEPKVTDFGLAKRLGDDSDQTKSGAVMGTPSYMAPEQAEGKVKEVGPAADIYALGAILYEMLTGRPPFKGETPVDTLLQTVYEEPVPPSRLQPKVPRDLETICLMCIQKDPQRRFIDAGELAADLDRFLANKPIKARRVSAWERGLLWVRRHKAVAALLSVSLMVSIALAAGTVQLYLVEKNRQESVRTDVRDLIVRARAAVQNDSRANWENAHDLMITAVSKLQAEPALDDALPEVKEFLQTIIARLAALDAFDRFARQSDDALFHATLATGEGAARNLEVTRQRAQGALDAVGLSIESSVHWSLGPSFNEREKQEIGRRSYELLLILADAVAQPLSHQSAGDRQRRARRALQILDHAPQLGLRTHSYHSRRARYLAQSGDKAAALLEQELAGSLSPSTALDHYLLGDEHYKQGELKSAQASFKRALILKEDHFWARYFLAVCYLRAGEPALARDSLTACLSQRQMVWIYLMRGYAHGQLEGEYDKIEAEADFQKALDLLEGQGHDHTRFIIYNNRAVIRLERKNYKAAAADLHRAIALKPDLYHAHATLAQVSYLDKNKADALKHMGQAVDLADRMRLAGDLDSTTLALLFCTRSRFLVALKDLPAALADIEQAIRLLPPQSPSLGALHTERGRLLQKLNKPLTATAAYADAAEASPNQPKIYRERASCLVRLMWYQEAIEAFDKYLELGGKQTVKLFKTRAAIHAKLGNPQAVADELTAALRLEPKNVALRLKRGQLYQRLDADQLAVGDFDEALRHDLKGEDRAIAYKDRGFSRVRLGRWEEGIADAEEAVRLGPSSPHLIYGAARVYALALRKLPPPTSSYRYQNRALDLIRQALLALPAGQRARFWRSYIRRDSSVESIRKTTAFATMAQQYGATTKK